MMSANVLPMLGVRRRPAADSPAQEDTARRRAGRDAQPLPVAGALRRQRRRPSAQRILLDGTPYAIVGVLPASFRLFQKAEVFLPIGAFIAAQPPDRGWHPGIQPIARLKDGVSIDTGADARSPASRRASRRRIPRPTRKVTMLVTRAQDVMVQGVRTALLVLLGAVAGVLLIACINVAGLLLARGLSRRRDVAVRIAVGASRWRVVGHLLAESVLISIAGGAAGLVLAAFSVPVLLALVGPTLPRADTVAVDWRVVAVHVRPGAADRRRLRAGAGAAVDAGGRARGAQRSRPIGHRRRRRGSGARARRWWWSRSPSPWC